MPRAAEDHRELLLLLVVQRSGPFAKDDSREADDGIQRCAKLMRHGRQKRGFHPIGHLGPILGFGQIRQDTLKFFFSLPSDADLP